MRLCTGLIAFAMCVTVTFGEDQQLEALSPLDRAIFQRTNQQRVEHGVSSLEFSKPLSELAQQHSEAMANGKVPFGHQGAEERWKKAAQRMEIRYAGGSENVYMQFNQASTVKGQAEAAIEGWLNSEGHRKNMLSDKPTYLGVGSVQNEKGEIYSTQLFLFEFDSLN